MPGSFLVCDAPAPVSSEGFVVLGKIVDAYGLRGAVKVFPFADDPERWARLPCWWIGRDGFEPSAWQPTRLLKCKAQGQVLIAEFESVRDRNSSEAVRGMLVGVPRSEMPPTDDDEYYWADLIGMQVVNTHGLSLGNVLGLIETSANDVLRVGGANGEERLLPFVKSVVQDVDLRQRSIRVDWEVDW